MIMMIRLAPYGPEMNVALVAGQTHEPAVLSIYISGWLRNKTKTCMHAFAGRLKAPSSGLICIYYITHKSGQTSVIAIIILVWGEGIKYIPATR
jgi:hypothetical protein